MKVCPKCNATADDSLSLCARCGTPLTEHKPRMISTFGNASSAASAPTPVSPPPGNSNNFQQPQYAPNLEPASMPGSAPKPAAPAASATSFADEPTCAVSHAPAYAPPSTPAAAPAPAYAPTPTPAAAPAPAYTPTPTSSYNPAPGYTSNPMPPYAPDYNGMGGAYGGVMQPPMKWYKFLIYFALFAGSALNLINGIMYFIGGQYNSKAAAEFYWALLPSLKAWDIIMGILCLAFAAYGIYVRFALAKFKKNAPLHLYTLYIAVNVASIIYRIAVYSIVLNGFSSYLGASVDSSAIIITVAIIAIFTAVLVVLNGIYFKKRAHLFVN